MTGCLGVGLSSGPSAAKGSVIAATGMAMDFDTSQWTTGTGPVVVAADHDDAVMIDDLRTDEPWPDLPLPDGTDHLGVVALPGGWSQGGLIVLTVYVDRAPTLADLRVIELRTPDRHQRGGGRVLRRRGPAHRPGAGHGPAQKSDRTGQGHRDGQTRL